MFVCPECGQSAERMGHCTNDGARLEDGSNDALLGQMVGSYRIARLIGAGGMGAVYKGVQPAIGSRVAIKVLSHDPARSPTLVERFFAEARAVNVIRHEHIVNVMDLAYLPDGRPYIIMEHLDGEPLSSLIERRAPFPLGSLARMLCEVLDALSAAHEKGVVHRDLKPDNLFVTPNGHVKVLDFGIAKLRGEIATPGDATRTGALLGTPHYMSPEQALARQVDARADLYAVGVIAFEAATGRRPFEADSLYELLRLHVERPAPSPRALRPDMPPAYEATIVRALEKDPARRFQSAAELAHALGEATRSLGEQEFARVTAGGGSTAALPPRTEHARGPAFGAPVATAASAPPPYMGTYAGASLPTHPARPAPKSHALVWLALSALGVIGLLGLAFVLGVAFFARDGGLFASTNDSPETPTSPGTPGISVPSPVVTATGSTPSMPPGYDAKAFDVWKFFDEAERLARQHESDARFVRLDVYGMRPNGTLDLTMDRNHVLYRFRSPSKSVPPAGHPTNRKYETQCIVYVYLDGSGLRTYPAKWTCDFPYLAKPRCSPSQIWKASEARGAPRGNLVGDFGFWADDSGRGRWYVDIDDHFSQFVPDAC